MLKSLDEEFIALYPIRHVFAARLHSWVALERGDARLAVHYAQQADAKLQMEITTHGIGDRLCIANAVVNDWLRGAITAIQQDPVEAQRYYEDSLRPLRQLSLDARTMLRVDVPILVLAFTGPAIVALSGLGRIAAYHSDQAWARRWLDETLTAIRELTGIWETTIARAVWGRAYLGWGEYAAAAAQLSDDLGFYTKAGARRMVAETLEGLGMCAVARGDAAHATRPWGAAAALRSDIGAPMFPADRPIYERHVAQARLALGERFDAVWEAGSALSWQDAAEEALAALESSASMAVAPILAVNGLAHEAALAAEIQAGLLPALLPQPVGWQLAAALLPARETAGDFYDCIALPDDRLVLVIADVAGKGLGAALYMATGRALIRSQIAFGVTEPAALLAGVNARLLEDTHAGLFITAFIGVLDPMMGTLTYANAGHPPALLLATNGPARSLLPTGLVLGVEPNIAWREETVALAPGNRLLLYTDGVTEAQDVHGAFFDTERLLAVLNPSDDAASLLAQVRAAVESFAGGAPQFDDITLLAVGRER